MPILYTSITPVVSSKRPLGNFPFPIWIPISSLIISVEIRHTLSWNLTTIALQAEGYPLLESCLVLIHWCRHFKLAVLRMIVNLLSRVEWRPMCSLHITQWSSKQRLRDFSNQQKPQTIAWNGHSIVTTNYCLHESGPYARHNLNGTYFVKSPRYLRIMNMDGLCSSVGSHWQLAWKLFISNARICISGGVVAEISIPKG